jgi:hypothetical protein
VEKDMKKKTLAIGAIAVAAVVAGGWAVAQTIGPPSGSGPPFMHGKGHGPGMMGHGPGMMKGMGGHGPGMTMGGHGPGTMKGMGPMTLGQGAFADPAQIDWLKGELGITAAQETAWSKYANAIQDGAAAMKTARENVDPGAVRAMGPSERFAFVSRMREQGQRAFEAVRTAADELLAVLDDAQKAKANTILPGLAFGHGPMRGPFAAH